MQSDNILDDNKIKAQIKRLSYQIYEQNQDEKQLVIVGIKGGGFRIAELIYEELENISPLNIILCQLEIDKNSPLNSDIIIDKRLPENANILLVDDVLNSGKTLIYAVSKLIQFPVNRLKVAVLIDRSHKKYPIKADYKGISLSTSLNDNINLIIEDNGKMRAELQ